MSVGDLPCLSRRCPRHVRATVEPPAIADVFSTQQYATSFDHSIMHTCQSLILLQAVVELTSRCVFTLTPWSSNMLSLVVSSPK